MNVKVGMIVFNTCHADARVLREAGTLQEQGYQVRIFALANTKYPEGIEVLPNGVEVTRTPVISAFNLAYIYLSQIYHFLRRTTALLRRKSERADRPVDMRSRRERREAIERMPLWRRLSRRGRIRYASMGRKYRSFLRRSYLTLHTRLRKVLLPLHRPTQMMNFWARTTPQIVDWAPDVIHAHDANTLVPAIRAARQVGAAVVYDSHELWRHRNRNRRAPFGQLADALIESWGVRNSDAVISVSPGLVNWLQENYKLDKVHLLRNTPSRVLSTDGPSLREMAGLDDGDRIVLYTGRITHGRGIEEAMHAVSQLPENIHMVMLGYSQPDYLEELMSLADYLGITHRFKLAGQVPHEQVSATAAQADVSVVAVQPTCLSYLHCLPNKLFESIQAGLPVVASRLPDVAELLTEHRIGATYELGNPEELKLAIEAALADPDQIKHNVKAAAEILCWEVEQHTLINIYSELSPI